MRSLPGLGRHAALAALTTVVSAGIVVAMAAPAVAAAPAASGSTVPTGISFLSTPPLAAVVGTTYAVEVQGDGAAKPVTLDTQDHSVCTVAKSVVTFDDDGVCFLEAHQDADGTHAAADSGQLITVVPAVPVADAVLAPTITATVTSAHAKSSHGWYRTPVTVSFRCSPAANCPAPVSLTRNVAGQSVTRKVVAVTGASASVTVGPVAIDQSAPGVTVTGVRAGAKYHGAGPRARCRATDGVSGVVSCSLTSTRHGHVVTVHATAVDRAGNVARRVVTYRVHTR